MIMLNKGLDTAFIHYGIRKEDIDIIKNLTEEQGYANQTNWRTEMTSNQV